MITYGAEHKYPCGSCSGLRNKNNENCCLGTTGLIQSWIKKTVINADMFYTSMALVLLPIPKVHKLSSESHHKLAKGSFTLPFLWCFAENCH